MAVTWKSMVLDTTITATSSTSRQLLYTASNGIAEINHATVRNTHASNAYDCYIYIKSDATLSGALDPIDKVNVAADTTVTITKLISHRVPKSGTIQVHDDSGADLQITISGDERTQ